MPVEPADASATVPDGVSAGGEDLREPRPASFIDPVDLNAADQHELERIEGLDGEQAQAILRYRSENGPLTSWRALDEVPGLDAALTRQIREVSTLGDEERSSRR